VLSALLYALLYLFVGAIVVGAFLFLNAQAAGESPSYAPYARFMRLVIIALGVIFALFVLIDFIGGRSFFYYGRVGP
jgi:hypothetical protein